MFANETTIIAEAGTCHAGPQAQRLGNAMRYVDAAHKAGADAIKFQIFHRPSAETMFCWMDGDDARSPRWFASNMLLIDWQQVKQYAESCGMMFLASTFEDVTVLWLDELAVEATKVASRAAKTFPYGKSPEPYLISLGMTDKVDGIEKYDVCFLNCEAVYPSTAVWDDACEGFSDHSGTPWRAIDALHRGCRLVEVHFFIQPQHAGPDRPASLNCPELRMICDARDAFHELKQ